MTHPQSPTEQADTLTTELRQRRWRVIDGHYVGDARTETLASPHGPLTLAIQASPDGVRLALDAPARADGSFCYAWHAVAPALPVDVIDAVALAAEAESTFPFDENDAVDLAFLADAGWRHVDGDIWTSADGDHVFETRFDDPTDSFPIQIRAVPDGQPIRLTQLVSAQVLAALIAGTAPAQLPDTMTVRVLDRGAQERAWGHGGGAPVIRTVTISAFCPQDGQRRGTPYNHRFHEDGDWYNVDCWDNPCGHKDMYTAVLAESTALEAAAATSETRA